MSIFSKVLNFTYLSLWIIILSFREREYKYVYVKIRLFAIEEMWDIQRKDLV